MASAWSGTMTLVGREKRWNGEKERELRVLEGGRESCELIDIELGVWGRESPSSSYKAQNISIHSYRALRESDDKIRKIQYRLDDRIAMFLVDIVPNKTPNKQMKPSSPL
jgi:hypothetical protein